MKVGTVCFATKRGLGYLAKSFYDNGILTDVAYIRHGSIATEEDWYPDGYCSGASSRKLVDDEGIRKMIQDVDWMLFFETPFDWHMIDYARSVGTKTALMTMYECTPATLPFEPDLFLCPSKLDLDYFPAEKSVFIPIPVDLHRTKWRLRERAEVYVHNGGYLGLQGREGTVKVIEAMRHVQSPLRLKIRCQKSVGRAAEIVAAADYRIEYECGVAKHGDLYSEADVAVGAQIWNGCSLPLQEAFAAGLLVMNTNRFPMNDWLPNEPLITPSSMTMGSAARNFMRIEICNVSPEVIANKMDDFYCTDISSYSHTGNQWAAENSWEQLKPKYVSMLEERLES
tara:strand:- start:20622 stop:21644 length:1023 start_codon:yes stop_codon:yes gene_type:complete